jgi:peptidyl-prolyl cis-trans isomerase SurA
MTAQVGGTAEFEELYGKSTLEIKSDLREELRDQLLAEQFQGQKINGIKITPSEIKTWFRQFPTDSLPAIPEVVRLSHIVRYPKITDEAREEAVELISAIRDSIVVGGWSMEEMARNFTDDAASAENGGRYENSRLRELVPEFAAVASRSPIDEISQVFESPYGYHILRVNNRRGDIVDFTHILIQIDEDKSDPTEAIELLTQVRDSILTQNMPFELMARRHSEEEVSNRIGGRVLDQRTGERDLVLQALDYSWRTTINSIEVGEVSEPSEVELLDGKRAFHIIYLQRRVPEHIVDIQTDYERIEQLALQEKQNRLLSDWLDELRKDVYIEMRGKAREISLALNAAASSSN